MLLQSGSPPPPTTRITVLISGTGTNLQALIDACTSTLLPHTSIVRVISNLTSAKGLKRCEAPGIATAVHNFRTGYQGKHGSDVADKQAYDAQLADLILADAPDLVVCAGWMRILYPAFLDPLAAAKVPVINLHPALPGKYDGTKAIERAWTDFQDGKLEGGRTGVMVHYVTEEVDAGDRILVREVEGREGESLDDFEARMHDVEHEVIVKGTALAISELHEERRKTGGNVI